jgi:hypothetical protein
MVTLTGAFWCNLAAALLEIISVLTMLLFSNLGTVDIVETSR